MRAFTATGGLVRMVIQIGYDMRHLLLLLMVVICAGVTSFHVLIPLAWAECASNHSYYWHNASWAAIDSSMALDGATRICEFRDPGYRDFDGVNTTSGTKKFPGGDNKLTNPPQLWDMVLRVFGMMMGGFDLAWFETVPNALLGQLLWMVFMFLEMVLLLNLLIALMGDSYEKVQEKAKI